MLAMLARLAALSQGSSSGAVLQGPRTLDQASGAGQRIWEKA